MQTRNFGNSTLKTTPMGLGLAALGRPGYINLGHNQDIPHTDVDLMESHAHYVLDTAWHFGIRYFDAARSYGRAEQFLGSWLKARDIAPTDVTVGSKWGYTYTADWQVDADVHEVKEHSLDVLQRQWAETQENLGEYLSLYQIHSATPKTGVLENGAVLEELFRLKHAGAVIGLSLSGADQADTLRQALQVRDNGELLFGSVQATWNVLETSAENALAEAHRAGLGIIVKEVLANGRLTIRNAGNDDFAEQYRIIMGQAGRLATSVDALCTAAALAQPWAGVVLSGAANRVHLISNIAAMNVAFDNEAMTALRAVSESSADYWQTRSQLAWN